MDASKIMKSLNGMEVYDEAARMQINGIITSGTGESYIATVKAIDSLTTGVGFIMMPHVNSAASAPTLDVNGLGAKPIRLRLSSSARTTIPFQNEDFIAAMKPVKVVYDGEFTYTGGNGAWIIEDMVQPNANGLYGTVPISSGGTGADTVAKARKNLGLGETDGALPIAYGGTGCTTASAARKALGLAEDDGGAVSITAGGTGATTAEEARINIGAAASSHTHSGADITNGGADVNIRAANNLSVPSLLAGENISKNDDLDNIWVPGTYSCASEDVAQTISNTPITTRGFKLIVMDVCDTHAKQLILPTTTSELLMRIGEYYTEQLGDGIVRSVNWGSWQKMMPIITGNTAAPSTGTPNTIYIQLL